MKKAAIIAELRRASKWLKQLADRIETGPENSREEVSPMGRSPQRDCKTIPFHDLIYIDPIRYNQFS